MGKNISAVLVVTALLLFCTSPLRAAEINLFAAASLKEVINELSDTYAARHPGVKVVRNFGASGLLARQIESGAAADLFISANMEWIEYLKTKKQLGDAGSAAFAYNTLVFAGMPGTAASMADLPRLARIAIGSPKSVPAGEYAMEAFTRAGIDKQVAGKLVMARDVRECLMYAERGEVDGALVYHTDALQAKRAKILFTVPQELYRRVTYPMSLTVSGAGSRDAAAFFTYLQGNEARKVLARYGFVTR